MPNTMSEALVYIGLRVHRERPVTTRRKNTARNHIMGAPVAAESGRTAVGAGDSPQQAEQGVECSQGVRRAAGDV